MTDVTIDGFLGGRLAILQPARGAHRAGLDAVLLAAALPQGTAGQVLDLGAGVGVAGLAAAARLPQTTALLLERDPQAADLARRNAEANGLTDRVGVIETDVLAGPAGLAAAGVPANKAAHVILNPPFHPTDRMRPSPTGARADAHAAAPDDVERWIRAAVQLVDPRGTVVVIHRADELARLLAAVGTRLGGLRLLPVHPRRDAPAHRLILMGSPQSRAPLRLLPGFTLHAADGSWLPEADAVLRGGPLPVDWR